MTTITLEQLQDQKGSPLANKANKVANQEPFQTTSTFIPKIDGVDNTCEHSDDL
jgi:hypothetical protein